jgi:hypothetical protein
MAVSNVTTVRNTVAPNLPIAPVDYNQQYQDQFGNVLRLYFNQIDNYTLAYAGTAGGKYIRFPYVSASDSTTQYATANNTATIVKFSALGYGNGFTLNANSTATASVQGIYKITYSLQFANNDNAGHDAVVWLRVNGADVAASTTIFSVPARKSAGVWSYVCGYSEVVFQLNPNDVVGLWWGTEQAADSGSKVGNYIFYQAAQTTPMAYPSVPSAIGSITFVSAPTS